MTEHEHTTPERPCATCAAPLADGQDWCLECGSAQPGRLGGRPGWRAALTVLALTVLLAGGAAAAAYAALSSEARREAAAPPPPAAVPQVAQPPVQTTPAVPAPPTTPEVKAPESDPADVPEPEADAPAGDGAVAPTPTPSGDAVPDEDVPAEPEALDLPADAGSTYDPYKRAAGQAGDPADALDGKPATAWQVPVGADGKVRVGLAVSLEKAQQLSKLAFQVGTPGFTVEIYGTRAAKLPPDILDARWEHISDHRDVGTDEEVELDGTYRHVMLWVTSMPADTIVQIPEVQVFG